MKKTILAAVALIFAIAITVENSSAQQKPSLKILFIGNSYIYTNKLPDVLKGMLESKGYTTELSEMANPGWRLTQHADSPFTQSAIAKTCWDYIVLQEQSALPTFDYDRRTSMVPAIKKLKGYIKSGCSTKTVLFLTWGYKGGLSQNGLENYSQMQERLKQAYYLASAETDTWVVPVGSAWKKAYDRTPPFSLWLGDGNHPSLEGTYLAACVFYKFFTQDDPRNLPVFDKLKKESTAFLQEIASQID